MFSGKYQHNIDQKGRLSIPAKFRDILSHKYGSDTLILTRFLDNCIVAYPLAEWKKIENKAQDLSTMKKDVRTFLRLFYANATEINIDAQGRILIPPTLRDFAKLGKEIVLVGFLNKIEIWSKEEWECFENQNHNNLEELAENIPELGI